MRRRLEVGGGHPRGRGVQLTSRPADDLSCAGAATWGTGSGCEEAPNRIRRAKTNSYSPIPRHPEFFFALTLAVACESGEVFRPDSHFLLAFLRSLSPREDSLITLIVFCR